MGFVPEIFKASSWKLIAVLIELTRLPLPMVSEFPGAREMLTPDWPTTFPPKTTFPLLAKTREPPAFPLRLAKLPVLFISMLPVAVAERELETRVVK